MEVIMRQHRPWRLAAALAASLSILIGGCTEEEGSLFNPNAPPGATPSLSSLAPADSIQGGVDTVFITGTNFSAVPGNNIVYFNANPVTPFQASSTLLRVKSPLELGDSVAVRVAVSGSVLLSNSLTYKLTAAIGTFGLLGQVEKANAITVDGSGDLYVSVSVGGSGQGIKKIAADGSVSSYARDTTGVPGWGALKFGPGGYLYATRGVRAIYRFAPGGGSPAVTPWVAFPIGVNITTVDFDQNQILWAAGSNTNVNDALIYSITQTPATKSFSFPAVVQCVRVFDSYLYIVALQDSKWGIWRALISGDSISVPELYFDFDNVFSSVVYSPQEITFSANGDLYIATNAPGGCVVVTAQSVIVPYADYHGLFGSSLRYLYWGTGTDLFAVTAEGVLLRILARRLGAPYFGP